MNRALTRLALLAITLALATAGAGGTLAAAQTTGGPNGGSPSAGSPAEKKRPKAKTKRKKNKNSGKHKKGGKPRPKSKKPGPKGKKPKRPPRKPSRTRPERPATAWWHNAYIAGTATQVTTNSNVYKRTAFSKFAARHGVDVRLSQQPPVSGGPAGYQWTGLSGAVVVGESRVLTDHPATSGSLGSCSPMREEASATGSFLAGLSITRGVDASPIQIRFDESRDQPGTYSSSGRTCTDSSGNQVTVGRVARPATAPTPPSCLPGDGGSHTTSVKGEVLLTEPFTLGVTCDHVKASNSVSVDTNVTLAIAFVPCPAPTGAHRRC